MRCLRATDWVPRFSSYVSSHVTLKQKPQRAIFHFVAQVFARLKRLQKSLVPKSRVVFVTIEDLLTI